MKKILFITSNVQPVPDVKGGAIENLITILAEENENYKNFKLFVCSKYDSEALKESIKFKNTFFNYYKKNTNFNLLNLLSKFLLTLENIILFKKYKIPNYYFWTFKKAKKINPDYIIAAGGLYENFILHSKYFGKKKLYAWLHRNQKKTKKLSKIFNKALAISKHIANVWDKKNSILIRNCYDDKRFFQKKSSINRTDLGIQKNIFLIAYCGRIIKEKGVKELILSTSKLNKKDVGILLIGSSFYRNSKISIYQKKLKRIASNLKINLYETGFIHGKFLKDYLSICNLCVVPSIYPEPQALVPLEAMAVGVPVIISDVGGMKEYYDKKSLLKVKTKNFVVNLKKKIFMVYNNPKLREKLQYNGLKYVKQFKRKDYYNKFKKIFS